MAARPEPEAAPDGRLAIPPGRPLRLPDLQAALARIRAFRLEAWALAFGAVTLLALALRLVGLDDRPLHHDESSHAWFVWQLVEGRGYEYDPVFHGPVQFYLPSLLYLLIGAGDFAVRLAPALLGAGITFLPYFLRRQIGSVAAFATACLLCISPSFLYFTRFAREDAYVAFFDLLLIVLIARFLAEPRPWHPSAILGVLALAFATKETTYITVFVAGTFFLAALGWQVVRARSSGRLRDARLVAVVHRLGLDAWAWGVATFLAVYTLLFTTFFTHPQGLRDGLYSSIEYWLGQQEVNRGDQPWFYYLVLLPAYEWPVLLLGVVGTVVAVRRGGLLGALLVWMAVGQLLIYSWASERMPWLTVHMLLPLALLAGIGFQAIWRARRGLAGRVALAATVLGAAFSVYSAVGASYLRPADPRELLVQVQSSQQIQDVRGEIATLDDRLMRQRGRHVRLVVDSWGGTGWPWAWYLRDLPVNYVDMSQESFDAKADAVLVADVNHNAVIRGQLRGYRGRRFKLREWWVPQYERASPLDWSRWVAGRRTWTPRASMDEWLYVRKGVRQR